MLHELDKVVGSLVTEIEDRNMADNTIIVFTSDNGGLGTKHGSHAYGHSPSGPLKGAKGKVWEGGHRVPMIMRYDNHFPVNERRNRLLGLHDIYATLIELAGLSVPYGSAYDSISFADYLYSEDAAENLRESLGTWKQHESAAVRVGEMKYIEFYGKPKPPELHNLTSDIRERTNLLESDNAEYVVLSNDMKQILDGLSREGPDASNKFIISTGFGFQDEILSDCEFFKSDPKRCGVYWEGLFNCRSSCHPDHH
jgi:arylsulfatase A-like enzyme